MRSLVEHCSHGLGMKMADYEIRIFFSEADGGYIAEIPELKYCSAFGHSAQEALAELERARDAWLLAARETGAPIPEARKGATGR